MNRAFTFYPVLNFSDVKTKVLNWANQFSTFCLLDNHQYNPDRFTDKFQFECLVAAGSIKTIQPPIAGDAFGILQQFVDEQKDWVFGHLAYDLKNEIEDLSSQNYDGITFPDLFFFVPEVLIILKKESLGIGIVAGDADSIYNNIFSELKSCTSITNVAPSLKSRFSKEEYLNTIKNIQQNILRGDCYEINFCQEFYAENVEINPLDIYVKLSQLSPNPFGGFYRVNDKFLFCSSPERYLKKVASKIYSQPIKGTARRNLLNKKEDESNKNELSLSKKEISENVMVVDLVRNDLSKVCVEGSITVEELFGVYTFPQVHQMISTVSGTIDDQFNFTDIVKATFPMGSMTGVPKKKVMQLIEKYERTKRGIFSGALGYITPEGDFDFNVVIRSIMYNSTRTYVSMQAGSAITFYSNPENEYEECQVKIEAMKKVLS